MHRFLTVIKLAFKKCNVCISLTDVISKSEVSVCLIAINFIETRFDNFISSFGYFSVKFEMSFLVLALAHRLPQSQNICSTTRAKLTTSFENRSGAPDLVYFSKHCFPLFTPLASASPVSMLFASGPVIISF